MIELIKLRGEFLSVNTFDLSSCLVYLFNKFIYMAVYKSVKLQSLLGHPFVIVRLLHVASRVGCESVHLVLHTRMFLQACVNKLVEVLQGNDLMV